MNLQLITFFLGLFAAGSPILAQSETATPSAATTPFEETIVPTFETQKMARTYVLDIPGGHAKANLELCDVERSAEGLRVRDDQGTWHDYAG